MSSIRRRDSSTNCGWRASEFFLQLAGLAQLVDLEELRPAVGQGEQRRFADDIAEAARQEELAIVGEVVEVLLVVLVRGAEDVARREAAGERRPRNADRAEDEADMRLPGGLAMVGSRSRVASICPGQNCMNDRLLSSGK